jgi:hypothetical protein
MYYVYILVYVTLDMDIQFVLNSLIIRNFVLLYEEISIYTHRIDADYYNSNIIFVIMWYIIRSIYIHT